MEPDRLAIERFKSSFQLHIVFSFVAITWQLVLLAKYPAGSSPILCALVDRVVIIAFRWYARDLDDQKRVRWLFGWTWIVGAAVLHVVSVLSCPSGLKIDHVSTVLVASGFGTTVIFQNVFSIPSPCRMSAILIYKSLCHTLTIEWATSDSIYIIRLV